MLKRLYGNNFKIQNPVILLGYEMEPTVEQLKELFRLSYLLTKIFLPIYLVRIDERTDDLVILAGDKIEITVDKEGRVGYDQTEFQNDE
ncbi:DUF6888 family protein [Tolypothrix sp. VBCCA 56010]|uniref:DUF6888 family protein n=1 Tax=Tolypothrix sp. VBCCA 56010 TaxID=3137731 RepID=UPI003D7CED3C